MELDGTPLVDPDARARAIRLAEELEHAASSLEPELAAEMYVKAADIHHTSLGDDSRASSLLRRAIQADGRCLAAIARLRDIAAERSDWAELANVLDLASKVVTSEEQRAHLIAQRGDVLGRKLGRIAEARGLYREAARLSPVASLKEAALEAAGRIESILSEKKPLGQTNVVEWSAVSPVPVAFDALERETVRRDRTETDPAAGVAQQFFRRATVLLDKKEKDAARSLVDSGLQLDPDSDTGRQLLRKILRAQSKHKELLDALISLAHRSRFEASKESALLEAAQLAAGPLSDVERALELYQECLSREPLSEQALAEAVLRGVGHGVLDVARRVLPQADRARRSALLEQLAEAAAVAGDERAARDLRAAAFDDAPGDPRSFQAAVEVLRSKRNDMGLVRVLELRRRATKDQAEKRAIAFELASLYESQGQARDAAESFLDSIRLAGADDDISYAVSAIDRLSRAVRDRTIATRAHGAAAAREGIAPELRAKHLFELARILEHDLGEDEAARAAREEAESSVSRSRDAVDASLAQPPKLAAVPILDPIEQKLFRPLDADGGGPERSATMTDADWSIAIEQQRRSSRLLDTIVDESLSEAERARMRAAEGEPIGWSIERDAVETLESVRILEPLVDGEAGEASEDEPPTIRIASRPRAIQMPEIVEIEEPVELEPVEVEGSSASAIEAPEDRTLDETSSKDTLDDGGIRIEEPILDDEREIDRTQVISLRTASSVIEAEPPEPPEPEPKPIPSAPELAPLSPPKTACAAIVAALRASALGHALDLLAASVVAGDPTVPPALWLRAAELAVARDRPVEAESCLQRLLELSGADGDLEAKARRMLADVNVKLGAPELAAAALAPLVERAGDERARLLLEIGRLRRDAGDLEGAKSMFEEARALGSARLEASIDLLRVLSAQKDAAGISRLDSEMEGRAKERSAPWLSALGEAKGAAGDVQGARDALLLALSAERIDLRPAEALFDLAHRSGRSDWIDEALRELRARATETNELSRAFLIAAVLVARGAHHEQDRMTYESLRGAFRTRPRAPLARGWIETWLSQTHESSAALPAVSLGERIAIEGAIREALDTAQRAFGIERIEVMRLTGATGRCVAIAAPSYAIAIADGLLEARMLKGLRFDLARAVAALVDPRLLPAVDVQNGADVPESIMPFVQILDRAGLLLSGDAAIALETVGPKTARGEALTAFAASRTPVDLWAEIGLGVAKVGPGD
jgi:tetratricopeptide (TPR) repeat protein